MESNSVCNHTSDEQNRTTCSGSPSDLFNHRIGRHEVLLPINHNYNIICDILRFFLIKTREILRVSFASSEKMPFKRAHAMVRTVQL